MASKLFTFTFTPTGGMCRFVIAGASSQGVVDTHDMISCECHAYCINGMGGSALCNAAGPPHASTELILTTTAHQLYR